MAVEVIQDPSLSVLYNNRNLTESGFTPPAAEHYKHAIYLWDTGFITYRYAAGGDPDTAREELELLLSTQDSKTGFIPNMTFLGKGRGLDPEKLVIFGRKSASSDYSQPPVLAMSALKIHEAFLLQERLQDAEAFIDKNYDSLASFYRYFPERQQNETNSNLIYIVDPSESGRDSDRVFDDMKPLRRNYDDVPRVFLPAMRRINGALDYASALNIGRKRRRGESDFFVADVMFNCIYAQNLRHMADLSSINGRADDAEEFTQRANIVEHAITETMWNEEDEAFYPLDHNVPIKKLSAASLFPVILEDPEPEHIDAIVGALNDEERFKTSYRIPTHPVNTRDYDPGFAEPRLWRGPVWINVNWYIAKGLEKQANRLKDRYPSLADRARRTGFEIALETKNLIAESGYREFYDPRNGRGLRTKTKNFAWSTLADTL